MMALINLFVLVSAVEPIVLMDTVMLTKRWFSDQTLMR